jgi:hypothetical protein
MTVFIVATTHPEYDSVLKNRFTEQFPNDYYEIGRGQFLVAFNGTARTLYTNLIEDKQPAVSYCVIFGINGYYGITSMDVWEWMSAKLKG